jgi:transcription initiation factor TFIID subunit TAF12
VHDLTGEVEQLVESVIVADIRAQILGDVLDSFVLEAAGGAVRMAKHRKSDKIEVKDAAFFLVAPHFVYVYTRIVWYLRRPSS